MLSKYGDGENSELKPYQRSKSAFVCLYTCEIRNVRVQIGQLREDGSISQFMALMIERTDYPPGAQFILLKLSTVRQIWGYLVSKGWDASRKLTWIEKRKLDKTAERMNEVLDV